MIGSDALQSLADNASSLTLGGVATGTVVTNNFRAQDMRYRPDLELPSHFHSEAIVTIPLRGRLELRSRGRRAVCRPGMVFTVPAGEPHSSAFGRAGARSIVITPVDPDECVQSAAKEFFCAPLMVESPPITSLAASIADEANCVDPLSSLAVDGLVMQIMVLTLRTDQRVRLGVAPAWLKRAVDLIHAAHGRHLTLAEIAIAVDTTPSYLARAFRAMYGVSIASFARAVRFERASERLRATGDPIRDIARDTGFADQSHLTRVFKRMKGVTPAQYRREIRRWAPLLGD